MHAAALVRRPLRRGDRPRPAQFGDRAAHGAQRGFPVGGAAVQRAAEGLLGQDFVAEAEPRLSVPVAGDQGHVREDAEGPVPEMRPGTVRRDGVRCAH
jgi:hypothetical protein